MSAGTNEEFYGPIDRAMISAILPKSYHHWLGKDADEIMREEKDMIFFRDEILARQAECKPEADGWITVHPKV